MNKLFLLALFALVALYIFSPQYSRKENTVLPTITIAPSPTHGPNEIYVKRVIDGDTFVLNTDERVRYIGINSPEISDNRDKVQCFAVEAFMANKSLVEGKTVRLEKDVSNVDKYGRLLRYVYVADPSYQVTPGVTPTNEIFINDYLVKHGFAQVVTYPPDVKNHKLFLASQKEAKAGLLGVWQNCK